MAYNKPRRREEENSPYEEKLILLKRVAKVLKGGRKFSFSALVVVGDKAGTVGLGFGKANEVPEAIRKATESAKRDLIQINIKGGTIPHEIVGTFGSARVLMKPASKGTGVIAGGSVRPVLEAAGIHNIFAKSLGSSNSTNTAKAAMNALENLLSVKDVAAKRDKTVEEIYGVV